MAQIMYLKAEQLAAMTPEQINALSDEQLGGFNQQQLSRMPVSALQALQAYAERRAKETKGLKATNPLIQSNYTVLG
jgi:hypothetical protein